MSARTYKSLKSGFKASEAFNALFTKTKGRTKNAYLYGSSMDINRIIM